MIFDAKLESIIIDVFLLNIITNTLLADFMKIKILLLLLLYLFYNFDKNSLNFV